MAEVGVVIVGDGRSASALLAAARSLHERVRSGQADLAELVDFVSDDLIAGHVRDEDLKFALKKSPAA